MSSLWLQALGYLLYGASRMEQAGVFGWHLLGYFALFMVLMGVCLMPFIAWVVRQRGIPHGPRFPDPTYLENKEKRP